MGCVFCRTGSLGWSRNLTAGEITEQFIHLREIDSSLGHIVFMGMGEPLENFINLEKAVKILHHPKGFNISLRKMTVSSCGLSDGIRLMAEKLPETGLAVSLNSADENTRSLLMPVNKASGLNGLKTALTDYYKITGNRITLEYILFKGVNTDRKDAEKIKSFMNGLDAMLNLIPYNPVEGCRLEEPGKKETEAFTAALDKLKIKYTLRYKKGRDIKGACGQLGTVRKS
jgi:23S rRNA (adenine2503-C2)-methyltransferase